MALSEEDVRGIADYARIALSDEELTAMTAYMNDAVELLEPIRSFEGKHIAPTYHPIGDLANIMRPDTPVEGLTIDEALDNAASTQGRYFRVPQILGDGGLS